MTTAQIIQLAVQAILTLGGAWLAASLTMRLTLKRFFRERSWEKKAAAYTVVFEGLHDMLDWHGEHFEAEISGHEVPDDRRAILKERYRKARDDVRRSIAGQAWLLDPRVTDEIDALWRELHKRRNSMFEELDEGYGAIANSQQKIIAIAKQDLAR
ncbi:hypothetical protein [Brevundimonas sp.]|uniref:hypothetical protein n=1 Tax=Brevundimonas sp. TaxID=1871086 RepID=UPI0019BCD9AB|nr:hypothetical protein [Brevundimonas sp.]MBD3836784.1 hypothetical protein [Brevundimonas sp.]